MINFSEGSVKIKHIESVKFKPLMNKNMKHLIFIVLFSFSFILSSHAQRSNDLPPMSKPGACYAKSLIQASHIMSEKSIAVYTGTDELNQNDNLELLNIVVEKGSTHWEKKNDKYVLVEDAQKIEQVLAVKDVSLTDDFVMENFTVLDNQLSKGMSEWRQVICEGKLHAKVIKDIQEKLRAQSFYNGEIDGKIGELLNQSLANYQTQNNLPIGSYNYETMEALGVKIP